MDLMTNERIKIWIWRNITPEKGCMNCDVQVIIFNNNYVRNHYCYKRLPCEGYKTI